MAMANNFWYDPYTDQTLTRDQYMREMQQQFNSYQQALGIQAQSRVRDPTPKPIPQPEPFLNPVLLLLE